MKKPSWPAAATTTACLLLLFNPTFGFVLSRNLYAKRRTSIQKPAAAKHDEGVNIVDLEKQVLATAQAQLDSKRLTSLLDDDDYDGSILLKNRSSLDPNPIPAQWKIAVAASMVGSIATFTLTQNYIVSAGVMVIVFLAANGDPLEEDNLAGALARVLGRLTLRSVEASQPKLKALARAVVTGEEEIVVLKARIKALENENKSLTLWKERRLKIDDSLSMYSLGELKDLARENRLPVSGTKAL